MAGDCGLNALSLPAGKCAGPIPAENCANAQKIYPGPSVICDCNYEKRRKDEKDEK